MRTLVTHPSSAARETDPTSAHAVNSRLAAAAHLLVLLEQHRGVPVASAHLAASLNTHATHVRRLLGALAAAGITTAQLGAGGGALLARRAGQITLLDVYRAVDAGELFAAPAAPPDPGCAVGRNVGAALAPHFDAAARAVERELARVTVADLLREVGRQELRRARRTGV